MCFAACSLSLTAKHIAMEEKTVELKKKERLGVAFSGKSFQRWTAEESEYLKSGNVTWPSWCNRTFIHFCLLCFFLSYSWYTNLGKEVESKRNYVFLPEIFKCKEAGKYISDYNGECSLLSFALKNISQCSHFSLPPFSLPFGHSSEGTFPVYSLCSLGIIFVCMSKPANVAITEVITRRGKRLGLFPCEVSQIAESGPRVNFSVSQRYLSHLIRKKYSSGAPGNRSLGI